MFEAAEANQFEVIFRDIPPVFVRQVWLELEPEEHVPENIKPWKQGWLLKHDEAFATRLRYWFSIGEHGTAVRLLQIGRDGGQGRISPAARAHPTPNKDTC